MVEESWARGGTPSSGSARLRLRDSGSQGMGTAGSGAVQSHATTQVGAGTPGYGAAAPMIPYGHCGWALSWGCQPPKEHRAGNCERKPQGPAVGKGSPPHSFPGCCCFGRHLPTRLGPCWDVPPSCGHGSGCPRCPLPSTLRGPVGAGCSLAVLVEQCLRCWVLCRRCSPAGMGPGVLGNSSELRGVFARRLSG